MKKTILLLLSSMYFTFCFAQTSNSCDTIPLNTESDIKNAEPCILVAADYVLAHPLHVNDQIYHDYRKFIIAWMGQTPDYEFNLNKKVMDICEEADNLMLFGVYTTCLAKAALTFKKEFSVEALKLFVEYVKNPTNQVKQTAKVKKLIEDFNANKIDKYLK